MKRYIITIREEDRDTNAAAEIRKTIWQEEVEAAKFDLIQFTFDQLRKEMDL